MIETVADFLLKLKNREVEVIQKYAGLKHPGIIGGQYEGLSKSILDKAIFKNLNLKVTAGKIRNKQGVFSGEIDCMLVTGQGESIPYSEGNKEIYDIDQVIVVFQIKKNLFSGDLVSAHENLLSVTDLIEDKDTEEYHQLLIRDGFRSICQQEVPDRNSLKNLSPQLQYIYHSLVMEAFYPGKVVWGYNGFTSEISLRRHFSTYLEKNLTADPADMKAGFGPASLPDLIICDQYSLVKNNGIPFGAPLLEDEWMPLYFSSSKNPLYYLLEIVWTRLQYMFHLEPGIFGEDLDIENMPIYLAAKIASQNGVTGWGYREFPLSEEALQDPPQEVAWEPALLTRGMFIVFNYLAQHEEIIRDGKDIFNEVVKKDSLDEKSFAESLKRTGLIHIDDNRIKLMAEQLQIVATSKGLYAADNKTGRLIRWLQKNFPQQP